MTWIHDDHALLAVIIAFGAAWFIRGWIDKRLK